MSSKELQKALHEAGPWQWRVSDSDRHGETGTGTDEGIDLTIFGAAEPDRPDRRASRGRRGPRRDRPGARAASHARDLRDGHRGDGDGAMSDVVEPTETIS
jgi:hypothetical protein